jgi:hypothetical protein
MLAPGAMLARGASVFDRWGMNTQRKPFVIASGTSEVRSGSDRAFLELELTMRGLTIRTMGAPSRTWTVPGLWAGWRAFERLSGRIVERRSGEWRAAA